jgi:hypothetical protein
MKKDHQENREQYLDRAGCAVLRAAPASDEEINAALASPFLYSRIRARINDRKELPPISFYQSLMMFSLFRRAIPILALIAILAVCSYNFAGRKPPAQNSFADPSAYLPISDPNTPVTACSITSRTECLVSTNEVLALLVNSNERQPQK